MTLYVRFEVTLLYLYIRHTQKNSFKNQLVFSQVSEIQLDQAVFNKNWFEEKFIREVNSFVLWLYYIIGDDLLETR